MCEAEKSDRENVKDNTILFNLASSQLLQQKHTVSKKPKETLEMEEMSSGWHRDKGMTVIKIIGCSRWV